MSVIQKQSINHSIVNYVGVVIGTISTLFIYPLSRETYGLARFLIDTSIFLYPFILLGFEAVTIRFFPDFKNEKNGHNGFLGFLFIPVILGCIGLSLISLFWGSEILLWLERVSPMKFYSDPMISQYVWLIIPITICMSFAWLFNQYSANFHKITVPAILQNFIKITLPILVLIFLRITYNTDTVAFGILGSFMLVVLLYIIYVWRIGQLKIKFDPSFIKKPQLKSMLTFALYSLFGGLGTLIAFRIDSIMVSTLLDLEQNGDFGITSTIAQTIAIPTNAVIAIAAPILSAAWASNDREKIAEVYQKASLNLLIPGLLIFTGMAVCLDHLFNLMPNGNAINMGKWVVLTLGFAKIIDMATSVNNEIISYSKHFRFNFYAVGLLALTNITFNFIFIKEYGIWGAALATALSILLYKIGKFLFIYIKFNIQPFTIQTLYLLVMAGIAFLGANWIPDIGGQLANLLLKAAVVSLVFLGLVYFGKISSDFNHLVNKMVLRKYK
ncbi:MAG: polysaccharide biosynthesis C-terminal domain-containing protein [Saprospiraceae bacterium]|nr:polysaccharide biosynthesis C-terminal domain-containing protein [Saprospiraceae bacterium]